MTIDESSYIELNPATILWSKAPTMSHMWLDHTLDRFSE